MRNIVAIFLIAVFSFSARADHGTYNVRYLGGTIESKDKDTWENKLTVTSDELRVQTRTGESIVIDPKSVTSIAYGREATRHVARWVALGILVTPLALLGLFNQNVQHFVSIEYEDADHKKSGILIQAHKDNYREVLSYLRGATGKEIEVEKNPKNIKK
jgi:hypothetical protein